MLPIEVDNGTDAELNIDIDLDNRRPAPWSQTTMMADSNIPVAHCTAHLSKLTDPIPSTPLRILSEYHRGSISTTRTSLTESSTQDIDEPLVPLPRVTSRPRASYKLADFIIQRTLGTGSFGRVHLGQFFVSVKKKHFSIGFPCFASCFPSFSPHSIPSFSPRPAQYEASITFVFTRSRS